MNHRQFVHRAISASAGSGKTYQLAHRYIDLLASGVPPERICALTFSRKAAGEIFTKIAGYLLQAASSTETAEKTAARIGKPGMTRDDFLRLLKLFLSNLNQTAIGTLDSFTIGIAQIFAPELGISAGFSIMENDSGQASVVHRAVLERIFNPATCPDSEQTEFLQAFKLATFGVEEKQMTGQLIEFITERRREYREIPDEDRWGNPDMIWPSGCPWLPLEEEPSSRDIDLLLNRIERIYGPENPIAGLSGFIQACREFSLRSAWSKTFESTIGSRLFSLLPDLKKGQGCLAFNRKQYDLTELDPRLIARLIRRVAGIEILRQLEQTQGIFQVLDLFERYYQETARAQGIFSFEDIQYLLAGGETQDRGVCLSRNSSRDHKLLIDYRLNNRLDHWLLDEFQDTSDLQWRVMENLIDEVLQDTEGNRSFFFVGDVKQAIYGWRGGNSSLFDRVLNRYGDVIELKPLDLSFRSRRAVIEMVNTVFSNIPEDGLPAVAVQKWNGTFHQHSSSEQESEQPSFAAVITPNPPREGSSSKKTDTYHTTAKIIQHIEPAKRGLETAVLVRSNRAGKAVAEYLRKECPGLPVVLEGPDRIRDNPATELFFSLIRFTMHPGDNQAWSHLLMSPIRRVLETMSFSRSALSVFLLKQLYRQGVSALLEWWISKLTAVTSLTEFEIMRLREFLQCAIEFDRTGDTNGDAFLEFARGQTVRAAGSAGSIRVMTIHKAKGLGFDIVILPELNRKEALDRTSTTHAIALHRDDPDAAPDWAFRMPRNTIRQLDPVLSEETEVIRSRNCLEELCVLYVALTRARLGLYMIATSPGQTLDAGTLIRRRVAGNPSSQTRSSLILAGETFECGGSFGDPDWYQSIDSARTEPLSARITFPQDFKDRPARRPRLSRIEPSSHQRPVQSAACLFDAGSVRMRRIGSAIHDLFSRIEWLETSDINRIIEEWKGCRTFPDDIRGIAAAHFKKALEFETLRTALSQPLPKAELWRERSFEVILPEGWVSGIFDRVTILFDADGGIERAIIQDFKSNRIEKESDLAACVVENEPQMRMYRRSLAEILKIPPESIELQLMLTGIGKIIRLKSDPA